MTTWTQVRKRNIALIDKLSVRAIGHIMAEITQEEATTYRDSGDGWTVMEVVGHLLDADRVFLSRAKMILAQDHPDLPVFDHEQDVIDGQYNAQDKDAVFAQLAAHRAQFAAWFRELTDEQWERSGTHPERDYPFTLTDALMQVALHDNIHLEQITRILAEKRPSP
ncbi:MAG: DinB family protein [Chloroflexota bacterium]